MPARDTNSSSDEMTADSSHVVVRYVPSSNLETAFRIHLLPETLDAADLRIGQPCELSSEDGSVGYGIAWRADDRMGNRPKNRPAKMTETVRSAFGFEEGSRVVISSTTLVKPLPATKIVLSDVTPGDWRSHEEPGASTWKVRTVATFANCEALASGISFEVVGRRKSNRRRFFIDSIESGPIADGLFVIDDHTDIVFPASINGPSVDGVDEQAGANGDSPSTAAYHIDAERIGGLATQIEALNRRLERFFIGHSKKRSNDAILIHGYEGTGKSSLLDCIAKVREFRKVHRLDRAGLTGKSVRENQESIKKCFDEAIATEPSLVVMDNLDELVPLDDVGYSRTLIHHGFDRIRSRRVMVVAATRSISGVHVSLLHQGRFFRKLELDIPDTAARVQILNTLRGEPECSKDNFSARIAARTHGYTGQDLADMYDIAIDEAEDRNQRASHAPASDALMIPPAYSRDAPGGPGITDADIDVALTEVRPTALRAIFTEKPRTRWEDIGGSQSLKGSFDEIIGWPLQHKDFLTSDYPSYQPPKGVLLYGPPGCSKTLTAQAVANSYDFNFIAIKGAELISMYVGESEKAIRDVFRKARAAAPCVIFFDEIDSIGGDRDSGGTKGLNVLTTLLNEMDGFDTLKDVFILAATNRPETLDPALMRPGRFDSHEYLGPPNAAARTEILTIATRGVSLAEEVHMEELIVKTEGYSGAELVSITRRAIEQAIRRSIAAATAGSPARASRPTLDDFHHAIVGTEKGITREMLERYESFARRGEEL